MTDPTDLAPIVSLTTDSSKQILSDRYARFFSLVADSQRWVSYQHIYFMALDAEWYEVAQRNIVLSYQIATVSRTTDKNIIEYMAPGQRLTLSEVIELGIRSVNDGAIPESHHSSNTMVILISHHVTAEWSVLADRREPHITRNLTVIRKSPVTGIFPIKLNVADRCRTDVHIYDTRLLAPATHQKLSELSKLLGDDNDLKIAIPHYYKKRMNLYLQHFPEKYEEYALQDSIVTLKLFFLLQESLMQLAGIEKLYRTLASAAVTGYLVKVRNFGAYQATLKAKNFSDAYKLIKRGYMGGRNEGFMVGRSDRHPKTSNRLWIDVDFVGCYPTAMALCPVIDCGINPLRAQMRPKTLKKHLDNLWIHIDQIPLTYRLEQRTDHQISDLGINPEYYRMARAALHQGHLVGPRKKERKKTTENMDFDEILAEIRRNKGGKAQAELIRKTALVVDNRLVTKWHQAWISAKESGDTGIEHYIVPGVARVRFDFKDHTAYPCLAVSHVRYGLIFPMRGETVATAAEIMLAMDAGAEIEALASVELPMVHGKDCLPRLLFFDHLARLTKARAAEKRKTEDKSLPKEQRNNAVIYERLLKEFLNSFYGKSAQAINYRQTYNPSTGEMKPLGGSEITEPSAATLTTGLARAALGAVLFAVEQFNQGKPDEKQIIIVSDTTDGVLLGLPRPAEINLLDGHYYNVKDNGIKFNDEAVKLPDVLKLCGCEDLMNLITAHLPIRQMRHSRRELTRPDIPKDATKITHPDHMYRPEGNDTFLEIKNMADEVLSVKTRGQVGWIKDGDNIVITILAKFGHKPPLSEISLDAADLGNLSVDELKAKEEAYHTLYEGGGTNRHTVEGRWIMQQLERIENSEEDIFDYTFFGLTGFNEIIKSEEEIDIVQKIGTRRFNGDFDWKRMLVKRADGTIDPISRPFTDIQEMLTYRHQMEAERRRGKNARPEKVIHRVEVRGRNLRLRGGEPATVVRQFLRAILHELTAWKRKRESAASIAKRLTGVWVAQGYTQQERSPKNKKATEGEQPERSLKNAFTRDDVENALGFDPEKYECGVIMPTPHLLALADALAEEFGVDSAQIQNLIFTSELDEEINRGLALQVVRAVLHAPGMGLLPFSDLYRKGQLPDHAGLVRAIHPHLTERDVETCQADSFRANTCNSMDRPRIEMLFRRLGIPPGKAAACARVLAPTIPRTEKTPRNPAAKKCMELFIQAVMQPDIIKRDIDPAQLQDKLRWYGLKKGQLYSLTRRKFTPRTMSDTPANRRQITRMAMSMGLDPAPIIDALMDR